ncbi:MAG: TetR/AcrR family transcriptional regulator [Candidatus Neoclostridium sp.]
MPAKPKFTSGDIVGAALEIAKRDGLSSVTAREVGKALGTSSSPIFTFFDNMDDLKSAVLETAAASFYDRIFFAAQGDLPYLEMGVETVKTAVEQPKLFRLLFVYPHDGLNAAKAKLDQSGIDRLCADIAKRNGVSPAEAELIHNQVWFYTFGLAMHCASAEEPPAERQIRSLLSAQFASTLSYIKSGEYKRFLKN